MTTVWLLISLTGQPINIPRVYTSPVACHAAERRVKHTYCQAVPL